MREGVLNQMIVDGMNKVGELTKMGAGNPQGVFTAIRLEVLIDSLILDKKDRLRYEGEVARRTYNTIQDMYKQMTEAQQGLKIVKDEKNLIVPN